MINIRHNVSLLCWNTLRFESLAEHYAEAHTRAEIHEALLKARTEGWSVFVLGGGSNVVLPEKIAGLTLRLCNRDVRLTNAAGNASSDVSCEHCYLTAGAGSNWHELVIHAIEQQAYGLENLSLIPGTAGAAPVQNIGAYGVELHEYFESLLAVNIANGETVTFSASDCRFGYRESIFKGEALDAFVISQITLRLDRSFQPRTHYQALRDELASMRADQISAAVVSDAVCRIRASKLPDPGVLGNAGSFFKNPLVPADLLDKLKTDWPNAPLYAQKDGSTKIAAGWMIERAGWKGYQRDVIGVHRDQALVLTHQGGGKSVELLRLANDIKTSVKETFGISLEQEPRTIAAKPT